jgi:hypothetical protein
LSEEDFLQPNHTNIGRRVVDFVGCKEMFVFVGVKIVKSKFVVECG